MKDSLNKSLLCIAGILTLFAASCTPNYTEDNPPKPNPNQKTIPKAVFVNPFPAGTYENLKANPSYPRTAKYWKHPTLFNSTAKASKIVISVSKQRGYMYNGSTLILDYAVATGKSKYPTPEKTYTVLKMIESDKRSSLYGKIYNAEGSVVNSNANSRKDTIPEGGKFVGASMPYWMRLSWDGIGMHQGHVPHYPASHGCIRTHKNIVKQVFGKVQLGTKVIVQK